MTGTPTSRASVELFWLPLGADGSLLVRAGGVAYEWCVARRGGRRPRPLFHTALEVGLGEDRYVIEMAPVWSLETVSRGVVLEGPVGARPLGRSCAFRYEVRCWSDGVLPDRGAAVASPVRLPVCADDVRRLLGLVSSFPPATWGRDEQRTGDMWSSNSLTSWLLARAGVLSPAMRPPGSGRAPGWRAGVVVAERQRVAGRHPGSLSRPGAAPGPSAPTT